MADLLKEVVKNLHARISGFEVPAPVGIDNCVFVYVDSAERQRKLFVEAVRMFSGKIEAEKKENDSCPCKNSGNTFVYTTGRCPYFILLYDTENGTTVSAKFQVSKDVEECFLRITVGEYYVQYVSKDVSFFESTEPLPEFMLFASELFSFKKNAELCSELDDETIFLDNEYFVFLQMIVRCVDDHGTDPDPLYGFDYMQHYFETRRDVVALNKQYAKLSLFKCIKRHRRLIQEYDLYTTKSIKK